jgi:hypothetical protein
MVKDVRSVVESVIGKNGDGKDSMHRAACRPKADVSNEGRCLLPQIPSLTTLRAAWRTRTLSELPPAPALRFSNTTHCCRCCSQSPVCVCICTTRTSMH